jgi:alpha-tubulin suppressor-like RCC1 family protein
MFDATVDANGRVYMWGRGDYGQLGLGPKLLSVNEPTLLDYLSDVEIIDIACGTQHSAAVDREGRLYTWGYNGSNISDSALGLGPATGVHQMVPALVETLFNDVRCFSINDWKYTFTHKNVMPEECISTLLLQGCPMASVDCGDKHTIALSADGEIWTWGNGANGRLGNGDVIGLDYPEPMEFFDSVSCVEVAAGRNFSLALRNDGVIFGWGKNNSN